MSNEALIADARDYAGHDEYGGAVLLRRLADALEAAERKPVIDREALARFIRDDAAYNYATILSDGEALALAEDILRFMSIEDKREAQAEALEAAADICQRIENDEEYGEPRGRGIQTARIVLRARAAEIREGRA